MKDIIMNEKYNYQTKDMIETKNVFQSDMYQIIKTELGLYLEDRYEDSMDLMASATSMTEMTYFENFSQTLRRIKTALKDKRIDNLQDYCNNKREELKDGVMNPKERKILSTAIDLIENSNRTILQLIYNIAEEVKEGSLKKIKDYYELIDTYFATISKKYDDFGAFVVDCYDNISKSLNLAYGGYNYGKK